MPEAGSEEVPERIVITGGSSGIGRAIAARLSSPSTTIVNLDVLDGAETAATCAGVFHSLHTDLGRADDIDAAFAQVDDLLGGRPPQLLVCCAAISRARPFLDVPPAELDLQLAVNVRGTFLACQQAARRMASVRVGRIVVITSIAAAQGWAGESVYCITKGAQQSLVQSLAVDLAPFGILVNAVAPGLIESTSESMAKTRADPDVYRHGLERTPVGRFGTVEEVAEAVNYLATVTWTTGQTMFLDGGFMATGLGYFGNARERQLTRQY